MLVDEIIPKIRQFSSSLGIFCCRFSLLFCSISIIIMGVVFFLDFLPSPEVYSMIRWIASHRSIMTIREHVQIVHLKMDKDLRF